MFTVYSVGSLGQLQVEGYGYHHLPKVGTTEDVEIQTWKPLGGINSQMRDYFLGASPHLTDSADFFSGNSSFKNSNVLNRFGMRSENSGKLRFRLQAAVSDDGTPLASMLIQGVTLRLDVSRSESIRIDGMRVAETMVSILGQNLCFDELHPAFGDDTYTNIQK